MLASIIFKKIPFFHAADNDHQLVAITKVLGTDDFFLYLDKYNINLELKLHMMLGWYEGKSWGSFVNADNLSLASQEAIAFLDKLLKYDHQDRLTAKEAMDDPYFANVVKDQRSAGATSYSTSNQMAISDEN